MASAVACAVSVRADELSGADKLRVVYSNQFAWTRDGLPLMTVRVAEGRSEVVITATNPVSGVRVLPEGEGGADVRSGNTWKIRVEDGRPAKVRWHVVVARLQPGDDRLAAELKTWRDRGLTPRTFEIGALFGVKGEVLDSRRVLIGVSPRDDDAAAKAEAAQLSAKYKIDAGVHPELAERPRGVVEATDERGVVVRNDGILWFSPASGGLLELREVDKEGGGKETRRYFGKLYVTVDRTGKLAVVNAVPEDKLLAGLVPAEMMPSSHSEALKAQSVAARNELLAKIGTRHLTDPYRLCATQHCQVYAGAGREDPRTTAAVVATQGELLLRESGGLVDAVYSASCGGHTEDNERAWGGTPDSALRGTLDGDAATKKRLGTFVDKVENVPAWLKESNESPSPKPYCARPRGAASSYRWSKTIDLALASAKAGVGALHDVEVLERGVSGRATRIRLSGADATKEIKGELEVRRALGGLKSALFVLDARKEADGRLVELVAIGGGHGHGIGMCQHGAVGMAESGASYRDILKHYYGASHVRRMY
ncbi:MAG TPA: SpoIID/LytB domain-containing protein [Kofleriaceae bacterium]|nr:SpoIID/LytB domain-containing protein [Kofleriaceae bacterium]